MSGHLQGTIGELETELESHYQSISDIERTLRYLRARAGAAAPPVSQVETSAPRRGKVKKGKTASRSERTNERTNERTSKAGAKSDGPAEPP